MSTNISNTLRLYTQPNRRFLCACKVCGDTALYAYFGAIVCSSCKMFFKRNAKKLQTKNLKCNFNYSCEININSRRYCTYCRLWKCFKVGMKTHMIRTSCVSDNSEFQTKNFMSDLTSTNFIRTIEIRQPKQLPTLNLVRRDLSNFSKDEWNLLSNILYCFDQYIGYSVVEKFIKHQNTLPPKIRFRCSPVQQLLTSVMNNVQVVIEKNRDFLSLPSADRMTLLRMTAEYTITMGGLFIVRHYRLFDDPSYDRSVQMLFRPTTIAFVKRIINQLDPDDIFIKLIVSLLAFSTINYRDYTSFATTNLHDIRRIISIQDMYTSLVWRYLTYKYGQYEAVRRFSNLIRCLFYVVDSIKEAHESNQFNDMVDVVIEETKRTLHL